MAITAGLAGYGTVNDTGQELLASVGNGVASVWIKCAGTSANSLLIGCSQLHGASFLQLEAGDVFVARCGTNKIRNFWAKSLNGLAVATVSWGVAAEL